MFKQYEMELGGRKLVLEFGKYAEQANGCLLYTSPSPRD